LFLVLLGCPFSLTWFGEGFHERCPPKRRVFFPDSGQTPIFFLLVRGLMSFSLFDFIFHIFLYPQDQSNHLRLRFFALWCALSNHAALSSVFSPGFVALFVLLPWVPFFMALWRLVISFLGGVRPAYDPRGVRCLTDPPWTWKACTDVLNSFSHFDICFLLEYFAMELTLFQESLAVRFPTGLDRRDIGGW